MHLFLLYCSESGQAWIFTAVMKLALALTMEQVEGDRCRVNVTTLKAPFLVFHYTDGYENIFIRTMMNFIFERVWTHHLTMSHCLQLINVTNNRVRALQPPEARVSLCECSWTLCFSLSVFMASASLCKIHALQAFSPYTYLLPFYRATFQHYSSSHTFPNYSLFWPPPGLWNSSCMVVWKESLQSPTTPLPSPFLFTWSFHPNFPVYVQCLKFSAI